jgi:hypothetical protein
MANQTQPQNNKPGRIQPKAFVFAKPDAVKPDGRGKYDITITLGTTREDPQQVIMVKLFVQDRAIDVFAVKQKDDVVIHDVVHDPSKPFEVRIVHADDPGLTDRITLPLPPDISPITKPAEPVSEPKTEQLAHFKVSAALSPDSRGKFLIEIDSVGNDGKISDRKFDLLSNHPIEVQVNMKGKSRKGLVTSLSTNNGKLALLVGFNRKLHEVRLVFKPDSLPDQPVLLVR